MLINSKSPGRNVEGIFLLVHLSAFLDLRQVILATKTPEHKDIWEYRDTPIFDFRQNTVTYKIKDLL
jgi:hypothetical protein